MTEEMLFDQAPHPPEKEPTAFQDHACPDAVARAEVDALLSASHLPLDAADDRRRVLAEPELVGSYPHAPSPEEAEGVVIAGRYKLRQKIGEGGMGTVWMADQTEPVKRKVAVKLIRVERGQSKTILARFEVERQAIALMDHPHIAKLLDAGTTETSAPFFVMELVKGIPLNDFCDRHRLSIPQRLNLFLQICQAVQHAHQKGVIHCDLKPTNILVENLDGKPVPKVIDFGLAKATSGLQLTEQSMHTVFGAIMGTPLYMAPEQAGFNVMDVDTRTDVYALGVILYELLTGTTPLPNDTLRTADLDEVLQLIREQDAPTPSSRLRSSDNASSVAANRQTEPQKLRRFVKGELDWIVLKALSKNRDRRYETVNGLAKDIERFLNHEPVQAGPPSAWYRFQKFVRRNRPQVIAAGLVLLALVSGLLGTAFGLREARRQADIAREEANEKERQRDIAVANEAKVVAAREEESRQRHLAEAEKRKAIAFRNQALDALRATTGTDVEKLLGEKKELTANERVYLEAIAERWQTFARQEGTDEQSRAVAAEGHFRVGLLWAKLGRREEARPACEQAVLLWEKLSTDFPAVPDYRRDLAASRHNLGLLLADLGERPKAEEQYRRALALFEKLSAEYPADPEYRCDLARSHNNLGLLLAGLGEWPKAEEQYRRALALQEKLAAEFPAVPEYRRELASTHNNLGLLLTDLGLQAEAEEQFRKGLALREKLSAEFPAVPGYRFAQAQSHTNLANLLAIREQRAEAEKQHKKGLALEEKLAAEFPAVPEYRSALAASHTNLGALLADPGRQVEAEEHYRKGLTLREKLAAEFPTVPDYRNNLAKSHIRLGVLLKSLGKRAEAERQFRQGLALRAKLALDFPAVPVYRRDLALNHTTLGALPADLGQRSEAEEQYRAGLALQEKLAAEFPAVAEYRIDLGGSYCNLGHLLRDSGRADDNLTWFDRAIATLAPILRAELWDVTAKQFLRNSYWGRAEAYDRLGKFAEAVTDWDRAVELSPPAEQPIVRAGRATSRLNAGQVAEAIAEVAELTKASNWDDDQWYDFACVYTAVTMVPKVA